MNKTIFFLLAFCSFAKAGIQEQEITSSRIFIRCSNQNSVSLTRLQIAGRFAVEVGTISQRRTATINWVKQQIADGLGTDCIDVSSIDFDMDNLQNPTILMTSNR